MADYPQFPTVKPKAGDWAKLTIGGITKIWDPATNSYQLPGTINKRLIAQGLKPIKVPGIAPKPPGSQGTPTPPASGSQGTPTPPASGSQGTPTPPASGSQGTPTPPASGSQGTPTPPASGSQGTPTPPASGSQGTPSAPAQGTPTPPAGGASGGSRTPSAPAQGTPGAATPASPSGGSGAPSTPALALPSQSSAANLPTADKIKSGMSVWSQQMKAGDTAGAKSTGMGVWAMSNPKLAAVAAERERTRGTAQTDNPAMNDFRSRLPVTPTVQSPTFSSSSSGSTPTPLAARPINPNTTATAFSRNTGNLAAQTPLAARPINPNTTATAFSRNTGNLAAQTPLAARPINQNASRAAFAPSTGNLAAQRPATTSSSTPTQRPATTSSSTPTQRPAQRASSIKPIPRGGQQRSALLSHYEYEPYDILLDYLISRGHADDLTEANYLMLEMDQTAVQSIMEEYENYLLSEEISEWINNVVYEGHDLSGYTIEELVEYYITEKYGTKKGRKR